MMGRTDKKLVWHTIKVFKIGEEYKILAHLFNRLSEQTSAIDVHWEPAAFYAMYICPLNKIKNCTLPDDFIEYARRCAFISQL
jgi:hypothetical protein